jgi:hypothetical protein
MISRIRVLSIMVVFMSLLGVSFFASAANATESVKFTTQSRAAGLSPDQASGLQAEVDRNLAKVGGTQVTPNTIALQNGAQLALPVPGENKIRDFSTPGAPLAIDACPYTFFCAYPLPNYDASQGRWAHDKCSTFPMPYFGNGSWVNNQTPGTRAVFHKSDGGTVTTGPPPVSHPFYNWTPVVSITVC